MRRSSITYCGDSVRANVFTEHGASTQTCKTVGEAQSWIAINLNRKPMGGRNATTEKYK